MGPVETVAIAPVAGSCARGSNVGLHAVRLALPHASSFISLAISRSSSCRSRPRCFDGLEVSFRRVGAFSAVASCSGDHHRRIADLIFGLADLCISVDYVSSLERRIVYCLITLPPPTSTLFPYTTHSPSLRPAR